MEWVVAAQLVSYLDTYNLMEPNQSAYRTNHSTENTLLKVKSDILHVMDKQEIVCLVLLDLFAAFDTIDHTTLLHRLKTWFKITGTALEWIKSYLTKRNQHIINDPEGQTKVTSSPVTLTIGIPHGSVLGPILFTLYTIPLGDICRKHQVEAQFYADDQQIYLSFRPITNNSTLQETCIKRPDQCIEEVRTWMIFNLLKLNGDRTEFIVFGTLQQLSKIDETSITVGLESIQPVNFV